MPIYNEAPSRVFGAVQAMIEDVEKTELGEHFDWFFLSDTTHPDVWIAEERAYLAMRERLEPHDPRLLSASHRRTRPARPAISGISSPGGAAHTSIWSCSTPTAS